MGGYEAFGLRGRTVLVTGGSKNIGRSIALAMADAGAIPLIIFREDEQAARKLCEEVAELGQGVRRGGESETRAAQLFVAGHGQHRPSRQHPACETDRDPGDARLLQRHRACRDGAARRRSPVHDAESDQFATVGVEPDLSTPAELARFIRAEIDKWGSVMKYAGMTQQSY